jgi:hypothetical protein
MRVANCDSKDFPKCRENIITDKDLEAEIARYRKALENVVNNLTSAQYHAKSVLAGGYKGTIPNPPKRVDWQTKKPYAGQKEGV